MARKSKSVSKSSGLIRVGVVGLGRGQSFMNSATELVGMKLVALCDTWEEKLVEVGKKHNVATYTDYDKFLAHDLDAVVLANYFHEHAPFAIKALAAGKHVMSETSACKTIAQGVALCRAVEKSGKTYMFAENYPFSSANQELRRLYRAGEIGQVRYAEGEYNHSIDEPGRLNLSPGFAHWRNWLPSTYYCTHALAPLMYITDTMPVSVNALSIVEEPMQSPNTTRIGDMGSVILTRMDNGAVFRIFGLMLSSEHAVKYALHGEKGLISTTEPNHWANVRIHHEKWQLAKGQANNVIYSPAWPEHADLAAKSGHGGGDFWTNFHFANAIRTSTPPYLDVYRGVSMTSVGILGWKSALQEGASFPVPDFKSEKARKAHETDDWSPFPQDYKPGQPPVSIQGNIVPSKAAQKRSIEAWTKRGVKNIGSVKDIPSFKIQR
jgi:predicted dehydrogenase